MQKQPPAEVISMLDYFSDPAILLNLNYQIVATNAAYRHAYGEIAVDGSRLCYEVSHGYRVPCDQAGETCPFKNALASGQKQRVMHLHYTPRGEEHVDVETYPIRDENGEIAYLVENLRQTKMASSQPVEQGLVGRAPVFNRTLDFINRVAPSEINVLLLGESGTGKEMVAQAIHQGSQRAKRALVTVECSGLSETLFESELFGHEKGAFTGAQTTKQGLVEAADEGTLFLDEVGDIPLPLQVKLLRLLETGAFRRVGSLEPRRTDFRLICATHRNLKEMVDNNQFRQDLYHRINGFPISLPSLKERKEDIPLLAESLLKRMLGEKTLNIDPKTFAVLKQYDFPGNVRELRNVLARASLMADGDTILPQHLSEEFEPYLDADSVDLSLNFTGDLLPLDDLERVYLKYAVARYKGDKRALAKVLGVSERTLYRKLEGVDGDKL